MEMMAAVAAVRALAPALRWANGGHRDRPQEGVEAWGSVRPEGGAMLAHPGATRFDANLARAIELLTLMVNHVEECLRCHRAALDRKGHGCDTMTPKGVR